MKVNEDLQSEKMCTKRPMFRLQFYKTLAIAV